MSAQTAKVDTRPLDPRTGKPIGPMAQPGYYPGFSTLSQQKFWDAKTREVVLDRVNKVPEIRFFGPQEACLLKAVCDRVLPQDDRDDAHKIPIVPQIDKRLYENSHDGYRYEGMPPDREAFRLGLQAIEEIAQHRYGLGFLEIGPREQVGCCWFPIAPKPTTRIPGLGTKSALVDQPTRVLTCAWSAAKRNPGNQGKSATNGECRTILSPANSNPSRANWSFLARPAREGRIEVPNSGRVSAAERHAAHARSDSTDRDPDASFCQGEEVDYVIVGVGPGGGVLLQVLARVIGFDAGPFSDTERDWVSDERGLITSIGMTCELLDVGGIAGEKELKRYLEPRQLIYRVKRAPEIGRITRTQRDHEISF